MSQRLRPAGRSTRAGLLRGLGLLESSLSAPKEPRLPLCKTPPEPCVKGTWHHLPQTDLVGLGRTEGRNLKNGPVGGTGSTDIGAPPPVGIVLRGRSGEICANIAKMSTTLTGDRIHSLT